jgi:hypothetical protein
VEALAVAEGTVGAHVTRGHGGRSTSHGVAQAGVVQTIAAALCVIFAGHRAGVEGEVFLQSKGSVPVARTMELRRIHLHVEELLCYLPGGSTLISGQSVGVQQHCDTNSAGTSTSRPWCSVPCVPTGA